MKHIIFSFLFILLIAPVFSQENIDVHIRTVKSDYVVKRLVMGTTRVVEDKFTGLKATEVLVYRETSYSQYSLIDSVFRYDSLLPVFFNDFSISDTWGDYESDYSSDDDYDDYDDGYDDYDYDDYDDYDDGYDDEEQYDDEYQDDYKVEDENGDVIDSTYVDDEAYEDPDNYRMDSSYVFLSYDLEYLSNSEISNNFADYIPDVLSAFDEIEGHKVHKLSILDTAFIEEKDTISSFKLEAIDWAELRQLPLKAFIGQKLEKFGKKDSIYVVEMNKPMTYEEILRIIMNTNPDFEINPYAWKKLESLGIDPNQYLADIVWISYIMPYYTSHIADAYLRDIFILELKKRKTEKILEFKKICSYDYRSERSLENIIQNKTILKNPRFERSIDPDKKVPIIKDNSQLAFTVTEELNEERGRYEYVSAGVISTMYEIEEITMADPKTQQPITFTRLKIDPRTNGPILLETASFGITFKCLNLESLKTTVKNMKYDISKLGRNEHFINQKYLREIGKL